MIKQIIYILIALYIISIPGCGSNENSNVDKSATALTENKTSGSIESIEDIQNGKPEKNTSETDSDSWSSSPLSLTINIVPLELQMFNDFLNDIQPFRYVFITVDNLETDPLNHYRFMFQINIRAAEVTLSESQVDILMTIRRDPPEPYWCDYRNEFNSDLMLPLFNELLSNSDYFFNHDEFIGLELPVANDKRHLNFLKKSITLSLVDNIISGSEYNGYGISKSVDELEPETPLFDLFQVIESEYITLLMQQQADCW